MRSIGCDGASNRSSDQSRKAARSSTSEPTEMLCGKPIPGTANCRELGEQECIMIFSPFGLSATRRIVGRINYGPGAPLRPWGSPELF